MTGTEGRIGVVIVNYRTPDLTLKCVDSILRWKVAALQDIVVVENASPDNSFERLQKELPPVRLIKAEKNGGFGSGVNIGAEMVQTEYLLVLNPDTYFEDGSVSEAVAMLDKNPRIGVVGLDLVYPGGERQYSARRFYSWADIVGRRTPLGRYWPLRGRIDRHMMTGAWTPGTPFEADWVMGTGFIARRALYAQLGGMDEAYFLYMEDVDLCARVWQSGHSVVTVPGARLVHDHQRSSAAGPFSWAGRMHLRSLMRFRSKFRLPLLRQPGVSGLWRHPLPVGRS